MSTRDSLAFAQEVFDRTPFMAHLGVELVSASEDQVIARLELQPWMLQQTGVAHAGIITAVADHTAACAARVNAAEDETFVSIEVHTSLIRPAAGPMLRIVGKPVRIGRRISFASADVFSGDDRVKKLCATFQVSLIKAPDGLSQNNT